MPGAGRCGPHDVATGTGQASAQVALNIASYGLFRNRVVIPTYPGEAVHFPAYSVITLLNNKYMRPVFRADPVFTRSRIRILPTLFTRIWPITLFRKTFKTKN